MRQDSSIAGVLFASIAVAAMLVISGCAASRGTLPAVAPKAPEKVKIASNSLGSHQASADASDSGSSNDGANLVQPGRLAGAVVETTTTPKLNDQLALTKAELATIVSPGANGCLISEQAFQEIDDHGTKLFSVSARDNAGQTVCQNYLAMLAKSGVKMQFANVPLQNDPNTRIKFVNVEIAVTP